MFEIQLDFITRIWQEDILETLFIGFEKMMFLKGCIQVKQ